MEAERKKKKKLNLTQSQQVSPFPDFPCPAPRCAEAGLWHRGGAAENPPSGARSGGPRGTSSRRNEILGRAGPPVTCPAAPKAAQPLLHGAGSEGQSLCWVPQGHPWIKSSLLVFYLHNNYYYYLFSCFGARPARGKKSPGPCTSPCFPPAERLWAVGLLANPLFFCVYFGSGPLGGDLCHLGQAGR